MYVCMMHVCMCFSYVLCGHSERRTLFRDDDKRISQKVKKVDMYVCMYVCMYNMYGCKSSVLYMQVLNEGLTPVLCIGETKDEYEAGLNHEVYIHTYIYYYIHIHTVHTNIPNIKCLYLHTTEHKTTLTI